MKHHLNLKTLVLIWILVGAGCGGSGGGGTGGGNGAGSGGSPLTTAPTSVPAAPLLSLGLGVKQLQFSWPSVAEASHYRLFENPDGVSGFTQVGGDLVTTAHNLDISVNRHDWLNARYLVEACNSLGCTASNEVDTIGSMLDAIGYFKASNTGLSTTFDEFLGHAVALSADGDTLAIGAVGEDSDADGINQDELDRTASGAGAVYVFARIGGNWLQQAYVKASNSEADDHFGYAVALSDDGNTLAVSAIGEDSDSKFIDNSNTSPDQADNSASGAGAVYVFSRNRASWSQQAYIKTSNTQSFDNFGTAIALSGDGNTLAAGATGEASAAGTVYVFVRNLKAWTEQSRLEASNAEAFDLFGSAVALDGDGDTLAVGAPFEDSDATGIDNSTGSPDQADNSASGAGAVYLFALGGAGWSQQAYVKASNTGNDDNFGAAVALADDGNTLAAGAPSEDSDATGVGSADNNLANNAGAVYVFARKGLSWGQQAYVKASNTGDEDNFGSAVALDGDGDTLAVGAPFEDGGATGIGGADNDITSVSGAAYVFLRAGASWTQQAYVKASNTDATDRFGWSLDLSADGNRLAVGATGEDSIATGVNSIVAGQSDNTAPGSGAAYLY